MSRVNKITKTPPAAVEEALLQLGRNIRTARLRRGMRLEDLAERVGASRYVMSDIEKGKPTTAIASYLGALWALGVMDGLEGVADPDKDMEGKTLEKARAPKTAAKRRKALDNDF
ncbi:MAG TPA: XRE family transcriptional regulator [Acidiferrobacteraceae bacterium]|nr:XRE family transcriptional regulator [Acidiferrobacteraceae bacterium]